MEVITSYLENLFLNLPKTPEVLRAKEELAHMMEDKYNELITAGKKHNEAIGIVISEFGDLEELADELGLGALYRGPKQAAPFSIDESKENNKRVVDLKTAEEYLFYTRSVSKWIAAGVMLCICSPVFLLICAGIDEQFMHLSDFTMIAAGVIPLLLMIAGAVFLFIYFGSRLEQYDYLKKELFVLTPDADQKLQQLEDEIRPKSTIGIAIGVVLCITSVIPTLIVSCSSWGDAYAVLSVVYLLLLISIAVACFIICGMPLECIKILRQKEEYEASRKKGRKIIDSIAGIYWLLVTAVYLFWSFTSTSWGHTWIIWPVAGVAFGAIAIACQAVEKCREL